MRIILASASPRRIELLNQVGLDVEVIPAHIDETIFDHESAQDAICRLANSKNQVIFDKHPDACVISADTMVMLNGIPYNKPLDEADAFRMLKDLSGRTHQVMTACVIQSPTFKKEILSITDVSMVELRDEDILNYIATKEPMDKAGAYAIQGHAGWMIEKIEGDFYTVVGLPLSQCVKILRENQLFDLQKR
jgi:septum formation protein